MSDEWRGDMGGRMEPNGRTRYHRPPSRVAVTASKEIGCRPETVHALIHGHTPIHHRYATILEAAFNCGDHQMVERLLRPIEFVQARQKARALDAKLICEARETDAAEDLAETRYLAAPSNDSLRGWLTEIRRERAELLRLEASIVAKLEAGK